MPAVGSVAVLFYKFLEPGLAWPKDSGKMPSRQYYYYYYPTYQLVLSVTKLVFEIECVKI